MKTMWQVWEIKLWWKNGRNNYERGRQSAWPVGTSPMSILAEVGDDPANGCDLAKCYDVSARMIGDPFEMDAVTSANGGRTTFASGI